VKTSRTARRLRKAIIFAAARGAATATGSGLVGLALWWITHH
jgi:plastocyanin domain-containing protein